VHHPVEIDNEGDAVSVSASHEGAGRLLTMKLIALVLVTALLAPSASAQQPPPGVTVKGRISKREARGFIIRNLPPVAATAMLKDERARYFRPGRITVEPARRCNRENRSIVSCRFRIRLRPTREGRSRNLAPIDCAGVDRVARLSDGGIGGALGNYRCVNATPR
jgi:hypothetical protein